MPDAPGTEDAAHLSFRMIDGLIDLLIAKGVITRAEVVTLFSQILNDLGKDSRAVAQRNIGYVRDTMIPKHQVTK
jgi:hypothetical protein